MKIGFHSYANETNFHMKSFALSLAFILRFKATRKWPILLRCNKSPSRHFMCVQKKKATFRGWPGSVIANGDSGTLGRIYR